MPSKYNEAISKIIIDEEKKEEIIKKLKENNATSKRVTLMFKIRKTITTIAAIAGIAICGGVAYAGISGKLNLFNNRIDTEYENYAKEIQGKYVEDKYSKISLNSLACDDAYLILNYTIDVKEAGKERFNDIKVDNVTGLELNFDNDITIEDKNIEKYSNFNQTIARKITDTKAEVCELVDLTGEDIPDKFDLKISNFKWYGENENGIMDDEKSDSMTINVSKKLAKKDTTIIIPEKKEYNYNDLKLNIDKIVKTPFETFIMIQTEEQNVSSNRFTGSREEAVIDLDLELYDENNKKITVNKKSIGRLKYEDGTYLKNDEGNLVNINYYTPGGIFRNATINKYFVIAAGDKFENANSIIIKPYYSKYIDDGKTEEKYFENLEWYDVKDEKQTIYQGTDESVQINKVDIKNDRILFYYTLSNPNINPEFYVRNKERAFNYFWADIENTKTPSGEYVTGIRTKDFEGAATYKYENGDNDQNADPDKYSYEAFLSDSSKLVYTVDFGGRFEKEFLGEGLTIDINK